MTSVLSFLLGLLIGAIIATVYLVNRYQGISNLLDDKLFVNNLLKEQIKENQAKKSKKYYRRNSYKKRVSKATKA
tara:strand:+ start:807 stop:1031 length:225 start_codon:yes stop_codon:yes gene_type:complete